MPEFIEGVQTHGSARNKKFVSKGDNTDDNYECLKLKFEKKYNDIEGSTLIRSMTSAIAEDRQNLKRIRCLGLGSPSTAISPLYQLCLLKNLIDHIGGISEVSIWDPLFTDLDRRFLEVHLKFKIEEQYPTGEVTEDILWYMPHLPIEVIEEVVKCERPFYMLTNDLGSYALGYSDAEYLAKYPFCATVNHLVPLSHEVQSDGFHFAKSKKSSRKRAAAVYRPAKLDYSLDKCHFTGAFSKSFPIDTKEPWQESFSNFAFTKLF